MYLKHLRSLCVLNQDLSFQEEDLWTAHLQGIASWNSQDSAAVWVSFASQESFRLCIYGLFLLDTQIAVPCNTRRFLSISEILWDLPPATQLWDATSADEWTMLLLEEIRDGTVSTPAIRTYGLQPQDRMFLPQVTQSLMTGEKKTRLLERISACPFATLCVLAALDSLVRDFTYCYYQMPPVLLDPSAYHCLSPAQNRPINAAVTLIIDNVLTDPDMTTQLSRLSRLMAWTVRLGLSEPDDLVVSGIADTALAAGLATAAHCVLGSANAKRRAFAGKQRRFGEDSSMTAWEDLLKTVTVVCNSTLDITPRAPPWMTALGYRMLLLLWRILRRAIREVERSPPPLATRAGSFSPANIIISLVCEKVQEHLVDQNAELTSQNPRLVESGFLHLLIQIFDADLTPMGDVISKILREIMNMPDIYQFSYMT